jgi:hypothetical protein
LLSLSFIFFANLSTANDEFFTIGKKSLGGSKWMKNEINERPHFGPRFDFHQNLIVATTIQNG